MSCSFWGPLFPWNPVKLGYKTMRSTKAIIHIRDVTEKDSVIYNINEIIQNEEEVYA